MRKDYYVKLDVIRIISCILILFYHLNIIKGGFLPVCTFFALSGYLSAKSAIFCDNFSIKKFYLKRLKSLYLPLIVVVALTVLIYKIYAPAPWLSLKPETASVAFGYNNFWQLFANFDYFTRSANSPFFHLWFIAILLQFDLVFPLFAVILKKANKRINKNFSLYFVSALTALSTILFVAISLTQDIMVTYYNSFSRGFSILFGVLFALIQSKFSNASKEILNKNRNLIFAFYSLILILFGFFVSADSKYFALFMIFTTIISVRLVKYATIKPTENEKAERVVKPISKGLYEVYLVQYPVIFFMQGAQIAKPLKVAIIIALTIILAYLINFALNVKAKNKPAKIAKIAIICVLIALAFSAVALEKDRSGEMDELKEKLSENEKLAEEKKNEFFKDTDTEETTTTSTTTTTTSTTATTTTSVSATTSTTPTTTTVTTTTTTTTTTTAIISGDVAEIVRNMKLVGVGDSLMLDAIDEFYNRFPNAYFDGKTSRSIFGGGDVLNELKSAGKLPDTLILCLVQNTNYKDDRCRNLMEIVGNRKVYWVNAINADDPEFNDKFKEFAKGYPNICIVDWVSVAKDHPEYFYADGVHTNALGTKAYVNTIFEAICNDYAQSHR